MFSRAAKSIVKTIGQRKYPAGEENIKLALIGGAGEIGRSLSQMLKQSSKLDVLALYDVAALNKRFSTPIEINKLCDSKITNTANSRMLTMLEKSRTNKGDYRLSNVNENLTEDFVNIHRLPTAEECATNQYSKTPEQPQLKATPETLIKQQHRIEIDRTSTSPLGIDGSIVQVSDRRNRGPLSIISSEPKVFTITSIKDHGVSWIVGNAVKDQIGHDGNMTKRETVLFEEGDRIRNDDYFPQGEDYEDEIGFDNRQPLKDYPNKRRSKEEELDMLPINPKGDTLKKPLTDRFESSKNP